MNLHISQAAALYGLYYAPDPSSQSACSIGGNVAENAGGPHCLKYGMTTNHILALEVPPLHKRKADILILANYFLNRYGTQYGRSKLTFSRAVLSKLMSYGWPGNVRELESVVHRAVVLASVDILQPNNIELPVAIQAEETETSSLQIAKTRVIEEFERSYLSNLLGQNNGNVSQAARAAGKDRRALQRMIRKHGIEPPAFR